MVASDPWDLEETKHKYQMKVALLYLRGFPVAQMIKNLPAVWETWVGDLGSIPVLGRSSGEGNSYPLQYTCLENSMDKGTWWATVHGFAKESGKM